MKFKVLVIGLVFSALSLIYVPYSNPRGTSLGYSTIYNPQEFSEYDFKSINHTSDSSNMRVGIINYKTIYMQIGAILLLTFSIMILVRNKE
jgi:hypothetical protein